MKKISVLVPTFNEEENVTPLAQAVIDVFESKLAEYDYEIVFIDNFSRDQTRDKIEAMCKENGKIKAIFNAKNFGQFNSPFYGLGQTTGDCAVLLCADFQDPVEMIPTLVQEWEKGHKIVCAVKTKSRENKIVRMFRSIYYKLIKKFSEVPQIEHFTGFGLYDRAFLDILKTLGDPTPFLRGIVAELGMRVVEVPYTQQKRRAGKTSNNFAKLYDAAMLSFTTYVKTPVRLMMGFGIAVHVLSLAGAVLSLVFGLKGYDVTLWAILSAMGWFFSFAFMFASILGEYLLTVKSKVLHRPLVVEEKRLNFGEKEKEEKTE